MPIPFSGYPSKYDMLFVEQMANCQYNSDLGGLIRTCEALSPGRIYVLNGLVPGTFAVVIFKSDYGFNVVSVAGTSDLYQLVAQLFGSFLVNCDGLSGQVGGYFAFDMSLILPAITNICEENIPLVCMGHSLGGASAEVLAAYLGTRKGYTIKGVYTIGSPKPGDAAFALNATYPIYRLINQADIVPSIPTDVPGIGMVLGLPIVSGDWSSFVQMGSPITQLADGTWQNDETFLSPSLILSVLVNGGVSFHSVDSYLAATSRGLPTKAGLVAFTSGYEKPWALFGMSEQPPGPWPIPGPPVPVPVSFTNRISVYSANRVGDSTLLGTQDDNPPVTWLPPLQGTGGSKDCCP